LQRLVVDVRFVTQTDAGERTLPSQAVAPVDIMRQASAAFEHQAGQQSVALDLDADDSVLPVRMDETRMTQVITNLLSNALRHTPAGGRITLGVRGEPDAVVLTVADTGSGISAENLPHIFDRFFRADDGGTSGLGLAIARALVAAQGGAIEAESIEGEGTTMRIRLPREKSA
jgi:two-component system, OmpR family, sensor histidine kinase BaeS